MNRESRPSGPASSPTKKGMHVHLVLFCELGRRHVTYLIYFNFKKLKMTCHSESPSKTPQKTHFKSQIII